ncbi:MAG TPA: efflux RND transporter periplasmic adaptor subunit [Urbifossiella sp.]|nr:efflux RND transporter periplasmic adaptor subunit [Urbifossiella sp.]
MPFDRRLLTLAALIAVGCSRTPAPAPGGPATTGPVGVKVVLPKRQTLRWAIEQPGTVTAFETTPVAAKLAGHVAEVAPDLGARKAGKADAVIDLGSVVSKGQVLATLRIPELLAEEAQKGAAVKQATAEAEQVKQEMTVLDAQVGAGKAMVTEAKAGVPRATAEFERWKAELAQADELVAKKLIDVQSRAVVLKQFQAAEAGTAEAAAKVATAAAALKEKQARRTKADADLAAAVARTAVAAAAAKEVEARIGYMRITAPFDGIVTARNVHTGHFVQPPAAGGPLFVVARLDVVRVFVDVPEAAAAKATPGAKATVRVPALGNDEFAGTVARTAGVVSPDTRTLRAEIDLPNEKRLVQPGMYAVVRIDAESADATVLPAGCVLPADETHYVYLVEDGKAVRYRVRVGRTEPGTIQVLGRQRATATTGSWVPFGGTEKVVNGNLGALADGTPVEVGE